MAYDKNKDYSALMQQAAKDKNYKLAAELEQQRNEKIDTEGLSYGKTSDYAGWMDDTDYSTQLQGAMGAGASADEVEDILGQRRNKVSSTKGMEGYLYDDITRAANGYAKRQRLGEQKFQYGDPSSVTNPYDGAMNGLASDILGRKEFSYDPNEDPLYKNYEQQYTRLGQRAMQDTLGDVASRTGGIASSYAVSAAQQANNGYMAQLSDRIPQLRQAAYDAYQNNLNAKRADLQMLSGLRGNALSQFNADRNFAYGAFGDERNFAYGALRDDEAQQNYQSETAYRQAQDKLNLSVQMNQQAFSNALSMWQHTGTLDPQSAKVLGLPAGTPNTDYAYQQAQMALQSQKAAGGGRSGGGGSGGRSGGGSAKSGGGAQDYNGLFAAAKKSEYPDVFIANNAKKFGFTSASGLKDAYQTWTERQQQGAAQHGASRDYAMVPGYGRLSWDELEKLVDGGYVRESYNEKTGKRTFTKIK